MNQYKILIKGTVSTDAKYLPGYLKIQIINRQVLGETVLASATPDKNGGYKTIVEVDDSEPPALLAQALGQNGKLLAASATVFEIANPLILDIFIPAGSIQGATEYVNIQRSLKQLAKDKDAADLTGEQLRLIAGKTRISASDLDLYHKAQQISRSSKISGEVLYGLFKKGLSPGLSSLYELNSLDSGRLIAEAVQEKIIPPQDEPVIAQTLEKIRRFALESVFNEPLSAGNPATYYKLLKISGASDKVIEAFAQIVEKHSGNIESMWEQLEKGAYGIDPKEAAKLKFGIQAGSLALGHLPMAASIIKLKNQGKINGIKDLVNWDNKQWKNFLAKTETEIKEIIPDHVPGKTKEEKLSAYALAMSRILEQTYPTEYLAAKIKADRDSRLKPFVTFINNNASFRIGETNIDSYLKENRNALSEIAEPGQFVSDLKNLQLQYMLSPGFDRYESIKLLQKMNLNSSVDVVNKGWKNFSSQYSANGGSREMAGIVYDMAVSNVAAMQNIQFAYGMEHRLETFVTGIPGYRTYLNDLIGGDPNLATLFGSQDFCRCKHCRSIYSPAAYLVDVLQFLSKADANTSGFNTALDVLFDRRPDLCQIELNCENTNTSLPYIDLINEIFENAVYRQTTGSTPAYSEYQTTGATEELLAHPEHIRIKVYDNTLKTSVYPWSLPFDLWTEEGRVYLEHLKLPRYKIMDAFLPEAGDAFLTNEAAIDELLKLSPKDRQIITGTASEANQTLWGLSRGDNLVARLKNPDTLLKYSGMEYSDLKDLLKTWFINPGGDIEIKYQEEHECDLSQAEITNLTEEKLMKMLRFTRLRNKLGWSARELDMTLKTFKAAAVAPDILQKISHIIRLQEYLNAPLYQILTFWGNIFTGHINDEPHERSPYQTLFLNKSVTNPVDTAFKLNESLNELAVVTDSISAHSAAVKAGLGISSAELDILVKRVLPNNKLNLANLSNLYRHIILAGAMNLKIDELIMLKDFSDVDPFDPARTGNIIVFLSDYRRLKKAKFSMAEIAYLLKREYDLSLGVGLSKEAIANTLTDIYLGLKKIAAEQRPTTDMPAEIKEYLKQKIASNLGISVDMANSLLFKYLKGPDNPVRLTGEVLQDNAFISSEKESITGTDFPEQFNTYVLLHKTALILRKFKISSHELDYLFADAFDPAPEGWPGWFDFNGLPVLTDGSPKIIFKQLLRLCDLFAFYSGLPSSNENLFELMKDAFNPASATTVNQLLERVSGITRWDLEDLRELSDNVFSFTKGSFRDEIPLIRLQQCMEILKLSGAKAVDAVGWTTAILNADVSGQILHSVKSLYSEKDWLAIARPLRNRLREKQKSALTNWLLHHQAGINNLFELYSYYLVDPEMSACMLSSRIRLALSSVQLFTQRCLMNLEPQVKIFNNDLEHWNQWHWMKTYRLWEANRKIFCYPENWIEPGLRDNKSVFFKELEQELEQAELNSENIEKAYLNYLSKLEAVSNIDILAICNSEKNESGKAGFYIFGRTVGKPGILYFRKLSPDQIWTPWERIDVDFEGNHLIPIVYNNKLHLFWPIFTTKTKKADIPGENEQGSEPQKYREIQMAWSVFFNGKWSSKRVTEEKIDELNNINYDGNSQFEFGTNRFFIEKKIDSQNNLVLNVYGAYHILTDHFAHVGSFTFNPVMKVDITRTTNKVINLGCLNNCFISHQEFIEINSYPWPSTNALEFNGLKIMQKTPSDHFTVTFNDYLRDEGLSLFLPFIYQDRDRTFLISFDWFKSWKFIIHNHYHPYAADFMNAVAAKGIAGLLDPEYNASDPDALSNKLRRQQVKKEFFKDLYGARTEIVHENLPVDEIDFSDRGAYSIYNWELFFHIPMLIADKLSLNQQFEEAQQWYHYIFDPTSTSSDYNIPQRFWKFKPFVEIYDQAEDGTPASIQQLMKLLNEGDEDLEAQVDAWRDDPFNPHLIARMRITAYQKNVVMKYLDNLLNWADLLFKQDTMETTNEAAQIYMLAWYILGDKPRLVDKAETEAKTYCELKNEGIDDFSNAMVELETRLIKYFSCKHQVGFNKFKDFMGTPRKSYQDASLFTAGKLWFKKTNPVNKYYQVNKISVDQTRRSEYATTGIEYLDKGAYWSRDQLITHPGSDNSHISQIVKTLYFCIPHNDILLGYWDFVEDRLFKLRNCMNIEGVIRQLPMFEPPLDPGMLVKAAASGMDLSSVLNDLYVPLLNYRFAFIIEKAKEFAAAVRNAGGLLLSALEKKDAEALALLKANNEITLMESIRGIKKYQLEEARQSHNALQESWNIADKKYSFYESREKINTAEGFQIGLMSAGIALQVVSQIINLAAAGSHMVPQFTTGVSGMASTPVSVIDYGGQQFANAATAVARGLNDLAGTLYQGASLSGVIASIQRRAEDWNFLAKQAEAEKGMISRQMEAALTRCKIAQEDIDNHEKQIEQRKAEYEHLKSKFTNEELYHWLTGQIASIYFQAYQMAYDLAKRAENSYQHELADGNDSFISYGYWDSLKKGLLAGEKLHNDLLRMEAAYLEKNKRTYEITKHISLGLLNPMALMQLRENGECFFDLPEEIFDMDYPGHYLRRIKSVSMTIPCISGPYSGVNATLTMLGSSIRKTAEVDIGDAASYPKKTDGAEDRFIENPVMVQSIATSSAQNDSGLFILDFNDARYLPFEGAGVISSWRLELSETFRSFDYNTISDVIIRVSYTSKDGGEILKASAENHLKTFAQNSVDAPLERLFSLKDEFGDEWRNFLNPMPNDLLQQLNIKFKKIHFPFMFKNDTIHVTKLDLIMQLKNPSLITDPYTFNLVLTNPASVDTDALLTPAAEDYLNSQPVKLGLSFPFSIAADGTVIIIKAEEGSIRALPEALRIPVNGHDRLNKEQIENIFLIVHYYTTE